jgi:hypothetical protein
MRKAAAVKATVPALSAPHKLGDDLPLRGRCDATDSPWFGAAARNTSARRGSPAATLACASPAGSGARKGSLPAPVLSRDEVWAEEAAQQRGGVELPHALERKYPRAGSSWPWFWVFPQDHHSTDPRSGVVRRQHLYDQNRQRHTPCATAWPLTCCRTAMTSARFRNCWAIQMSPRP